MAAKLKAETGLPIDRAQVYIEWARERGLHKLSLSVFAHNTAAIAFYHKFGFVEEGRRVKHFRRANGELWDALEMGLWTRQHAGEDVTGLVHHSDRGVQTGLNRSSQHRLFAVSVGARRGLRRGFSSRGSCGVGR